MPPAVDPARGGSGVVLRHPDEDERSARASALADAKVRDVEERGWRKRKPSAANSKEASSRRARSREARRKAEEERHRQERRPSARLELEAKKRLAEAEAKAAPWLAPRCQVARAPVSAAASPTRMKSATDPSRPGGVCPPAAAPKTTAKPAPAKQRGR